MHLAAAIEEAKRALGEGMAKEHKHFENLLNIRLAPAKAGSKSMSLRTFYNQISAFRRFQKTRTPGSNTDWIYAQRKPQIPAPTVVVLPSRPAPSMEVGAVSAKPAAGEGGKQSADK